MYNGIFCYQEDQKQRNVVVAKSATATFMSKQASKTLYKVRPCTEQADMGSYDSLGEEQCTFVDISIK